MLVHRKIGSKHTLQLIHAYRRKCPCRILQKVAKGIRLRDPLQRPWLVLLKIDRKAFPKGKRGRHHGGQVKQGMHKALTLQKALQQLCNMRKPLHFRVAHPSALQNRVRRIRQAPISVFLFFFAQRGSVQQLQKAKLQQIRCTVCIVKGSCKALIILVWKPCDQIQMHVDISHRVDPLDRTDDRIRL